MLQEIERRLETETSTDCTAV